MKSITIAGIKIRYMIASYPQPATKHCPAVDWEFDTVDAVDEFGKDYDLDDAMILLENYLDFDPDFPLADEVMKKDMGRFDDE